jgi:enhancing lycopene biosynthesis protein 2
MRVGVCLSGCGVYDGSEIHEAVITLLALDRAGAEAVCMAPDVEQMHVIDHRTGEPVEERRNVLTESARIARGQIVDLAEVHASQLDALILPGGFGAAKNLCDFAVKGGNSQANPELARLLREMLEARKPVGAICIAPAAVAAALRGKGLKETLTIGNDEETAAGLEALGARHASCPVDQFRVDLAHRIVSTPAYMLAGRISEAAEGIERLVAEVLRLAAQPAEEASA